MRLIKIIFSILIIFVLSGFAYQPLQTGHNYPLLDNTVKIGLLIPDNNSIAARHGAEMAIRKANENGGFNGRSFQLVVRSMEGPWGTGSKEAVNLIFEDNVCAIIGSTDGRNGHLIEQVSTKTRIAFLSTWASDPTLAKAFVTGYFSCVPTDIQQADAFTEEIYNKRKFTRVAAISDNSYDSKLAMNSFVERTRLAGKTDPLQLFYDDAGSNLNVLADQITKADINGIILFGKPAASIEIIRMLRNSRLNLPVFGTLSLLDEDDYKDEDIKNYEDVVLVSQVDWSKPKNLKFREEFQKTYGRVPGAVAAYSYDGMSLLLDAIKLAGTDRIEIQKALINTNFEGVTGPIQFDDKGKRKGTVSLMVIKNGVQVNIK